MFLAHNVSNSIWERDSHAHVRLVELAIGGYALTHGVVLGLLLMQRGGVEYEASSVVAWIDMVSSVQAGMLGDGNLYVKQGTCASCAVKMVRLGCEPFVWVLGGAAI